MLVLFGVRTCNGRCYDDAAAGWLLLHVVQRQDRRVHDAALVDGEAIIVGLLELAALVQDLVEEVELRCLAYGEVSCLARFCRRIPRAFLPALAKT